MLKTIEDLISRVMGTRFEREMKQLQPVVEEIHEAEERVGAMSEEELKAQTEKFRQRVQEKTAPIQDEIDELLLGHRLLEARGHQ